MWGGCSHGGGRPAGEPPARLGAERARVCARAADTFSLVTFDFDFTVDPPPPAPPVRVLSLSE